MGEDGAWVNFARPKKEARGWCSGIRANFVHPKVEG